MLNEDDLVKIFSDRKKDFQIAEIVMGFISKLLLFCLAIIASYVIINFYAFRDVIGYWYDTNFKTVATTDNNNLNEPSVNQLISLADQTTNDTTTTTKQIIQPDMAPDSIKISAINVTAPITWQVENLPGPVADGLSHSVIQIKGTALPGEKGNVYITGHSSNYVWIHQPYNSIFSNISKLVVGDIIYVKHGNDLYAYEVYDQKVVAANDLSILNPSDSSHLTLGTCWPLGTSLKRMVVLANQIYPDPANNKPVSEVVNFTTLPSAR